MKHESSLLSSSVDDVLVMFSAGQGMYYGTQAVGRRIWALVEDEVSVAEICDKLLEEFSVDRVTYEREVTQFVEQLADEGMVAMNMPALQAPCKMTSRRELPRFLPFCSALQAWHLR